MKPGKEEKRKKEKKRKEKKRKEKIAGKRGSIRANHEEAERKYVSDT